MNIVAYASTGRLLCLDVCEIEFIVDIEGSSIWDSHLGVLRLCGRVDVPTRCTRLQCRVPERNGNFSRLSLTYVELGLGFND